MKVCPNSEAKTNNKSPKSRFSARGNLKIAERARAKGEKILLFLLLFFCRYVGFAHSICFHCPQARYIAAMRQFDMR